MTRFKNMSGFYMDLMRAVEAHIDHAGNLPGVSLDENKGGILRLFHEPSNAMVLTVSLGSIELDKKYKYRSLSLEKCQRLMAHSDHVSSWQSRDPRGGLWGGAIRAQQWVIGFSGLPELLDEAVVTAAAYQLNQLTLAEAGIIADNSSNPHTDLLIDIVDRQKRTFLGSTDY